MSESEHERIVHVDDDSYEEAVADGLVLLDFWADWCGPCQALKPVVEELVGNYPELTVAKIDADENEAAMDDFGVRSIPTMIVFKNGRPAEVFAGKVSYTKLDRAIDGLA